MTADDLRARVKLRLGIDSATTAYDALLNEYVIDAQGYLAANCRAARTPGETAELDNITVALAVIAYTRRGMEGQTSHSEGGVSVSVTDALPQDMQNRINRLRTAKVG